MKQISISLSDEDYEILRKAAVADDRKTGNYITSQIVKPWCANLKLVPATGNEGLGFPAAREMSRTGDF